MATKNRTISDLVETFYGKDPIAGQDAANELLTNWRANAIEALVPVESGWYRGSRQVALRLKHVAATLGNEIVPHLVRVISDGPWSAKLTAALCFSGLKPSDAIANQLIDILKAGRNFDAERLAIESLGRLGADVWAYDLRQYARLGTWLGIVDHDEDIQKYPFEKLSSYVVEALARFAARATDRGNAHKFLSDLADFIELRETQLPNRTPDSYTLVEQLAHEFTEFSVDPVIQLWGGSANERLQRLCTDLLYNIAPLRAAKFLLETATSSANPSVRQGASIALAEIRVPQVAQRLADTMKNRAIDPTYLDWAFSTLYALPADWGELSEYADELLKHDSEATDQLHYSLALKGDNRLQKDLIERLDDHRPFTRWTSALALARLLGSKARPYLEHRAEDAGDSIERCAMYAAMVRVGDHEKAAALHSALQEASEFPLLSSIWKLEILDAFRLIDNFDQRAFPLWRDATRVGPRQLQYFDAMMASGIQSSTSATTTPVSSVAITTPQPEASPGRTKVFISYSHKDGRWLKRLQVHLKPLERSDKITSWDDTLIKPGERWKEKIKQALQEAKVAVLLISADFLASDFIDTDELPPLLSAAESEGVVVLPIVLSPCRFEQTKSLSQFQAVNPPSQPVNAMTKAKQEEVFFRVSQIIEDAFQR